MKDKRGKIILFIIFVVFGLWIMARVTGIFQVYHIPTSSMEPTLKVGSYVLSSNLVTPKDQDIICFKKWDNGNSYTSWAKRLVGLPGEVLQIKNSLVYVNGKLSDDSNKLYRSYITSADIYRHYHNILRFNPEPENLYGHGDSLILLLTPDDLQKFDLKERPGRYCYTNEPGIDSSYFFVKRGWTFDNSGKIKIPKDSCFVIGDSRDISQDSRDFGLIPLRDILGVIINKK